MTPLLYTPKDAAKLLAISERKLWDMTHRGEITCVRIDRSKRYAHRDLEAWLDAVQGRQQPVSVENN